MGRALGLLIVLGALSACGGSVAVSPGDAGSDGTSSGGGGPMPLHHRPDDAPCSTTPPRGSCDFGEVGGSGCSTDSDCVDAGTNGRCVPFNGGPVGCTCTHDECIHDTDCSGETCACHGSPYMGGYGNRCVPGNCRVDSDCGAGGYCSPTYGPQNCGGLAAYYCHTLTDQCIDDTDCGDAGSFQVCAYATTSSRWECQTKVLCH
jgi:Cys-rich repeat protein